MLTEALPTFSPASVAIGLLTIAVIQILHRTRPNWPGMLIAVALASLAVLPLEHEIETIGSVFGGIGGGLRAPRLPDFDAEMIRAVLPDAIAFTILGAIESLLSAVVAESMTGHKHRPNAELVGQGIANVGSALFGGLLVTGTIARTATNVRAGARSPAAGMFHALVVLAALILLAPLAAAIPLAALAGVLIHVSLHMIDVAAMRNLWRTARAELAILGVTLALTVLRDLTEAIMVGTALGSLYFLRRLARMSGITATPVPLAEAEHQEQEAGTLILTLTGACFFGLAPILESVLERISETPRHLVVDLSAVPVIDQTGARSLAAFLRRECQRGTEKIWITHASPADRRALRSADLPAGTRFAASVESALACLNADVARTQPDREAT
ncbi:sulfate permease, SulP family [Jhaorihella thermophila]|uniref:Sulfate permease, SulP family n=3 Tax=Jhaorihella thermophila TaxID=488547 RepID=A0A1H5V8E8_9RHOB|nr:sulfate permease, SulP family [Jhaorihella thermophila]